MKRTAHNGSLLLRILLSTSLAVTAVFAITGWMVQRYAIEVSERSLEEEIDTSLQAYQSLWNARVHNLLALSRVLSSMSDVRAAFMTGDRATIRDTAGQLWSEVSDQGATFLVLHPTGEVIASLGGAADFQVGEELMRKARTRFPNQVGGYLLRANRLYYVALTPVYVQAETGQALLDVLLVAVEIDARLAGELKLSTHGSDFAFVTAGGLVSSTLPGIDRRQLHSAGAVADRVRRMTFAGNDYLLTGTALRDPLGNLTGELFVIRSFAGPREALSELRRIVALLWACGIVAALALTYFLARRVLEPVKTLDRAAAEVIRRNYDYRVPVETDDELGRLARTFNAMCDSIRIAREDLIRQEQIATIGRLSGSIVHDLRNPLAAIYGGAEMLVDAQLSPEQQARVAASIYAASRRMQELLQELLDVSRAQSGSPELCRLLDLVLAARDALADKAQSRAVDIRITIAPTIDVLVSRDRLERVFVNLIDNALDAMPNGGSVFVAANAEADSVLVSVTDSGPGIPEQAWPQLFRPFASFGKKNGLGLGLALSRQTLLDSGGDLWAVKSAGTGGARFLLRLPGARALDGSAKDQKPSAAAVNQQLSDASSHPRT